MGTNLGNNLHRVYDPWGEFLWWEDDAGNVFHGSDIAPDNLPGILIANRNGGEKPAEYVGSVGEKTVYSLNGKIYLWDGNYEQDITGKAIADKNGVTTFSYDVAGNLKNRLAYIKLPY